jgi:hypothetical protein
VLQIISYFLRKLVSGGRHTVVLTPYVCLHKENTLNSWFIMWCLIHDLTLLCTIERSRGSSVSTVSDHGLDDRAIGVRSSAESNDFSCNLCVQTGSGAHPASCTMGTLTTRPHLVPRSWMSRSYTLSLPCAYIGVLWDWFTCCARDPRLVTDTQDQPILTLQHVVCPWYDIKNVILADSLCSRRAEVWGSDVFRWCPSVPHSHP